jgi:HK97 family phage major capsid protein
MPDPGVESVASLLRDIKSFQDEIARADQERTRKLEAKADRGELQKLADEMARKSAELQTAVEALSVKLGRPGGSGNIDTGAATLRQSARGLLELKHQMRTPKSEPTETPFNPSEADLDEAEHAVRGLRHMFKCTTLEQLPMIERKALTSFNMGASGFILQPEMSDKILSCLADITDLSGLVTNMTISAGSIRFMVDNVRIMSAGWACDTTCFANNPPGNFTEGLGEVEIKAETLRYTVCASRDILEDAAVNVEQWMFQKVSWAFKNTVSDAILIGDGLGKPLGLMHPSAGIPICDVGANTPAGTFTW